MIAAQSAKSWCQIHIDLASPSLGGDIPIYQAEKSPFWGWNRQFLMLKSPCVLKWPIEIDGLPIKKMWFSMAMLVITRWYMYNFFMVGEAKNPHGDHSGLIPGLRDTEAALHHGRSGSRGLRRIKELGIWAEHRKGTNRWTNYIYKYIYIYHIISLFHSSESSSIWSMEYLCPFNSHKNEYEMHHFEICGSPFEKTQP